MQANWQPLKGRSMSSKNLTGQCQCGYVKYHVAGIPVTMFACHCKECRRQSSSAFGLALWVRSYKLKLIDGFDKYVGEDYSERH